MKNSEVSFQFQNFNSSPETNRRSSPSSEDWFRLSHIHILCLYQEQTYVWRLYSRSKQMISFCLSFKYVESVQLHQLIYVASLAILTHSDFVSCPYGHIGFAYRPVLALIIYKYTFGWKSCTTML